MGIIDGQMQAPPTQAPAPPSVQAAPVQAPAAQPAARDARLPEKYTRIILAAKKILYDPETMKKILDLVKGAKTPEIGLTQATALVMMELESKSKGAIPQEAKVPAAKEIMGLIAELAEAAGIIPSAADAVAKTSKFIAQAIRMAADRGQAKTQGGQTPAPVQQGHAPAVAAPPAPMEGV